MSAVTCSRSREAKFRLLYLGSDLKLLTALRQVLAEPDYRLVACSDKGGAVLFLESEIPYDLMLIDLEWRGTEGLQLAQLAHSLRHRKRMPIILLVPTKLDSAVQGGGAESRREGVREEDARHARG